MLHQNKIGIILNPTAGKGRARNCEKYLIAHLRAKKIPFQLEKSNYSGHAREIAVQMSEEIELIVAAGGDGTINEIASGIVGSKTALAFLPIGSGNDFVKNIGISKKLDIALDVIINGKNSLVDLGQVIYWDSYNNKRKCYFINTLGLGLDAEIAYETKQIVFLKGLPLYLVAAIKALYKHSINEYRIVQGKTIHVEHAFFICAGNGSFEGGGFKVLPNAVIHDSQLDVCVMRKMPLYKALEIIPRVLKGTHTGMKKVSMWKTQKVHISGREPFVLHGDGEIFDTNVKRVEISIAAERINIRIPKEQVNEL